MSRMIKTLLVTCLLVLVVPAQTAEKLYKWVDADGNVHFSDRPPEDSAQAQEIEVDVEISAERQREARTRKQASQTQLSERQLANLEKAEQQAEQAQQRQRQETENQIRCAQARSNLAVLQRAGPVFSINDAGEREFVDDANRDRKRLEFKRAVTRFCR